MKHTNSYQLSTHPSDLSELLIAWVSPIAPRTSMKTRRLVPMASYQTNPVVAELIKSSMIELRIELPLMEEKETTMLWTLRISMPSVELLAQKKNTPLNNMGFVTGAYESESE